MTAVAIACLLQSSVSFVSGPRAATYSFSTVAPPCCTATSTRASSVAGYWYSHSTGTHARDSNVASVVMAAQASETAAVATRGPPVRSIDEAKSELLTFTRRFAGGEEHSSDQVERVSYLLQTLEGSYIPIQTVGFFNMAVQGKWHLEYTNAYMPPIGPRLLVSSQFQEVDPGEGQEGEFTNVLEWRVIDEGLEGRLEVNCGYALNPKGHMDVSLRGHKLLPNDMPKDPEGLVKLLRRAMPYEMFAPDEHTLETSFMDDSMRIVRVRGPRLEGRLNIFVRDPDSLLPAPPEEAQAGNTPVAEPGQRAHGAGAVTNKEPDSESSETG